MKFFSRVGCVTSNKRLDFSVITKRIQELFKKNFLPLRNRGNCRNSTGSAASVEVSECLQLWPVIFLHNKRPYRWWFIQHDPSIYIYCQWQRQKENEKALRETQTLAVVRRSQNFRPAADPLPRGAGRPKFNQLETVRNKPTNTHTHSHKPTDRTDYNTLHR